MAEELIDFSYSGLAKGRDVAVTLLASAVVGIVAHVLFDGPEEIEAFVLTSAGVSLLGVLVLGQARWRARGRLSESGVSMSRGPDGPSTELNLAALEEIRLFPDGSLDFIGDGTRVHVSGEMDGAAAARERLLSRRGFGLYDRLRDAYRGGETLEFRPHRDPGIARFAAGLYVVFFGVPMVLLMRSPSAVVLSPLMALLLWLALRREARRSMEAALEPDGLRYRLGLRTRRLPWTSIVDARLHENGSLLITDRGGRRAAFPPTLSNFAVLRELVLHRVSPGPGPHM